MPGLALPSLPPSHHAGESACEGVGTLLDLLPDRRQIIRAAQGELVAVPLRPQLAGHPFARVNPNPSYSGVRLRVSDIHDFISVEIRLFLARGRVVRWYVSRNYLRAMIRTPGEGFPSSTLTFTNNLAPVNDGCNVRFCKVLPVVLKRYFSL